MASLTVRNIPDEIHRALRVRAAQHCLSVEAEVRSILENAVRSNIKLGTILSKIGNEVGGVDFLIERGSSESVCF